MDFNYMLLALLVVPRETLTDTDCSQKALNGLDDMHHCLVHPY